MGLSRSAAAGVLRFVRSRQIFVYAANDGKGPSRVGGRGKLAERIEVEFGPFRPATSRRAECFFVALPAFWDLFICAKHLLVETKAPQAPTPKPFDLDQNFEPSARNRRPTIDVGGYEDARSSMSDAFDSLDATEKAAVEAGLNRCRTLVAQIQSKLRNMRPEHFVDKFLLADFLRLLAGAAGVVEQKRR